MHDYYADQHPRTPPLSQSASFVVVTLLLGAILIYWVIWTEAYHFTDLQVAEFLVYTLLGVADPGADDPDFVEAERLARKPMPVSTSCGGSFEGLEACRMRLA